MLTNKKIDSAISEFDIAHMNNVRWVNLLRYLFSSVESSRLFMLGKPVWSENERRVFYNDKQIGSKGIFDPGLFGNDHEEYREIEYIKVVKEKSNPDEVLRVYEYSLQKKLKLKETDEFLTILGYEKT